MAGELIRAATEADFATITAIYRVAVLNGTRTFEIDPPDQAAMAARWMRIVAAACPYLVAAASDGSLLGFAYAGPFRDRPAYRFTVEDSVYVAEAARGRGIGRLLLNEVVRAAERGGFRQMLALIGDAANAGSIALHAACGFAHVGTMRDTGYKQGRWLDVVVMQRALGKGGRCRRRRAEEQAMADERLVFALPQPCVPIAGGGLFPVRRVYCIGRNYAAHAREMGGEAEPPFFFQKPADAVQPIAAGTVGKHPYPPLTGNYHHEIELVVFLASGGRDIAPERALDHVFGYAVGFDMTRRDLQQNMKDARKPWEIGKAFDHSAPVGQVMRAETCGHLRAGDIALSVNGTMRQRDDLASMIWSVSEQVAELSKASALAAGDIIFSGTPAGVGPVVHGDVLEGRIAGLPGLRIKIV